MQGAIHAVKEMELDTKFQEAMKAVKPVNLEVKLSKMAYGILKPNNPKSGKDGMKFAQLIHAETKKAVCSEEG